MDVVIVGFVARFTRLLIDPVNLLFIALCFGVGYARQNPLIAVGFAALKTIAIGGMINSGRGYLNLPDIPFSTIFIYDLIFAAIGYGAGRWFAARKARPADASKP